MFQSTGKDIAALNDKDLRSLIDLLCEADLCRGNLSASAVTWGGNQTAKDGGLDVRVALPAGTPTAGFIKRPATGFQVKTPDMQRAKIIAEMCPDGVGRPVIAELARESGAYIIVSSKSTTADVTLNNRRAAMAEAVRGIPDAEKLTLDFYDSNRVATWVRDHAGLISWVDATTEPTIWVPIKRRIHSADLIYCFASRPDRPTGRDALNVVDEVVDRDRAQTP